MDFICKLPIPKDIKEQYPVSEKAAEIKEDVVSLDMKETGLRKILNFGHTVGHALESYYLEKENYLTHGEAVALGMYSALYL